jgi:hypothetical protein
LGNRRAEQIVLDYTNTVYTCTQWGRGEIKKNGRRGEFKYDI